MRLVKLNRPITAAKVRAAIRYRKSVRPNPEYRAALDALSAWLDFAERVLVTEEDEDAASMLHYESDEFAELVQHAASVIQGWRFDLYDKQRGG